MLKCFGVKNRGVAQLVARQFRVLEAASSSPATSTKKENRSLRVVLFFVKAVLWLELVLRSKMRVRISHPKIWKLAFKAQGADIFTFGENPATSTKG